MTKTMVLLAAVLVTITLGIGAASSVGATNRAPYVSEPFAMRAPAGAAVAGDAAWLGSTMVRFENLRIHDSDSDSAPAVMYTRIHGRNGWESTGWKDTARTTSRTWVNHRNVERTSTVGSIDAVFVKMCEDYGNPNTGAGCSPWQELDYPYVNRSAPVPG